MIFCTESGLSLFSTQFSWACIVPALENDVLWLYIYCYFTLLKVSLDRSVWIYNCLASVFSSHYFTYCELGFVRCSTVSGNVFFTAFGWQGSRFSPSRHFLDSPPFSPKHFFLLRFSSNYFYQFARANLLLSFVLCFGFSILRVFVFIVVVALTFLIVREAFPCRKRVNWEKEKGQRERERGGRGRTAEKRLL